MALTAKGRPRAVIRSPGSILRTPVKRAPVMRTPLPSDEPAPDPLDPDSYPADIEGSTTEELTQLRTGFLERMERERQRFRDATDAGYYFIAVFEVSAQVSAFLEALGIRPNTLNVDGRVLAKAMGIELPKANVVYNTGGPNSWAELVRHPKAGVGRNVRQPKPRRSK